MSRKLLRFLRIGSDDFYTAVRTVNVYVLRPVAFYRLFPILNQSEPLIVSRI